MRIRFVIFSFILILLSLCWLCEGEEIYKITAYCKCSRCCGKFSDGKTASNKPVAEGMIACNILPFGTKVKIGDLGIYTVEDRGSRKYFDDQKHIDIYFKSHAKARLFGVKYLKVDTI